MVLYASSLDCAVGSDKSLNRCHLSRDRLHHHHHHHHQQSPALQTTAARCILSTSDDKSPQQRTGKIRTIPIEVVPSSLMMTSCSRSAWSAICRQSNCASTSNHHERADKVKSMDEPAMSGAVKSGQQEDVGTLDHQVRMFTRCSSTSDMPCCSEFTRLEYLRSSKDYQNGTCVGSLGKQTSFNGCSKNKNSVFLIPINRINSVDGSPSVDIGSRRKAVVRNTDMNYTLASRSAEIVAEVLENSQGFMTSARQIKLIHDQRFGGYWHCIVGKHFAAFVTHDANTFVYVGCGQLSVLLFKSM